MSYNLRFLLQYRCLERMMCEYMQKEGDTASALISKPGQLLSSALGLGASETGSYFWVCLSVCGLMD